MVSAVSRLGIGVGRLGAIDGRRRGAEAFAALALAADAGVRLVDCPPVPEAAERVLGEALPREPAFQVVARAAEPDGGPGAVARRLRTSLRRMRIERAHAVLVQGRAITGEEGPKLWDALLKLKDEGAVEKVGVCACVCDDPSGIARRFRPDLMQLPLSLLDQRLLANGALEAVAERGVEVHLRSVFLHGLLFFDGAQDAATALSPHVSRIRRLLAEAGADPMQAALAFALSRPEASRVIVGIGSAAELRAVLKAVSSPGSALDWPALDWPALRQEVGCGRDQRACRAA